MVRFFFRKIFPILLTLGALIGAFLVYNHYQPQGSSVASGTGPTSRPTAPTVDPDASSQIHPGTGAWVTQFDRVTGLRTYRFKSDRYDNHPDDSVDVTNPIIEFFQPNGQIIHIEGISGVINMPPNADKGMLEGAATEPPRSGFLRHVTCKMYSSDADQQAGNVQMTLTMDNAQFDNDTYRLFTQQYVNDAGQVVQADQVPVKIIGKDYDFDGTGLVMYWNDPQKQLKSLQIDHGKQLTIHNAGAMSFTPTAAPAQSVQSPAPTVTPRQNASPAPAANNVTPTPPPTVAGTSSPLAPTAKPRYFATFYDNVRVLQAGDELVRAQEMYVDFDLKNGDQATPANVPATSATQQTATQTIAPPNSEATENPTVAANPPSQTATVAPPAKPDIKVLWDGKLTIVPTPDTVTANEPLDPGQSIIHLVGAPVVVKGRPTTPDQPITDVRCGDLVYHSADSRVDLEERPGVPLTIIQRKPDGSGPIIHSERLQFSKLDHVAVLSGLGSARFPDPNDPASILDARWTQKCIVHLIDTASGQMQIKSADLLGNVVVDHPKFHLTSTELNLAFDPPQNQPGQKDNSPQLRRMVATGDAKVVTHEMQGQSRSIESEKLVLDTAADPDGKLYAKTIHADGSVNAVQEAQNLTCQHLVMELLPAVKKPDAPVAPADDTTGASNVQLDRMIATDTVHVTGKDGGSADCDSLLIETVDGHEHVTLMGSPYAKVSNKDTTLWGPLIHVLPDDQISTVDGAGVMHTIQQPTDPTKQGQPMKVKWTDGIKVDGKANRIDVNGNVDVNSRADDGSINLAHSDNLVLTLEDKVPSTQPVVTAPKPTETASATGGDFNFMQNKQVKTVTFLGKAQLESSLTDVGVLLKRFDLFSDRIDYSVSDHRLTVPLPGKMLAEEHAPPATQPDPTAPAPGGRGATAFSWEKDFIYDETARQAIFEGDVNIVHRDDGTAAKQMSIIGDKVIADLQPATAGAAPANAAAPKMQISHVTVTGNVKVLSGNLTILCDSVDYDPVGELLIGRATDGKQVTVFDDLHRGGATFGEVWLNTKTNTIEKMTDLTAHGN